MRIVIRRDGRISVHEHDEEERFADPADPFAILACFRASVEFEQGLTAAQMMRALRPWSKALSSAAWFDFDAWFEAMVRPYISEAEPEDIERLSGIEIHPTVDIWRNDSDGIREVDLKVTWRTLGRFATPKTNESGSIDEHCSISFMDPRLIAHLPISISTVAEVSDIRELAPWKETPVLPNSVPEVYDRIATEPTFFDTVVLGFLDDISFHGSPEETEDAAETLRARVDQFLAQLPVMPADTSSERQSPDQICDSPRASGAKEPG